MDSLLKPNINRLIAAMNKQKLDRVPNFEIQIESRCTSYLLNQKNSPSLWDLPPKDAVDVVTAVGQDAIPCRINYYQTPNGSITSMSDINKVALPQKQHYCEKLKAYTDTVKGTGIGVVCQITGPLAPTYMACGPLPIESFMYLIYDDVELVEKLLDIFTRVTLELIENTKDIPFDLFYIGDDVCYNKGTMISPVLLKELWVPRMGKIIRCLKETGRPVMVHCCGDQAPVLPYFKKWGVDAVHPLQANANDIYEVKRIYGDSLTLVGNIDVATLLTFGSSEEVYDDTCKHIDILSGNGGYVVCSSHSIIDSVPPENYLAMVKAAHEHGIYP